LNALAQAIASRHGLRKARREWLVAAACTLEHIGTGDWLEGLTEADRVVMRDYVAERTAAIREACPRLNDAARAVLEAAERAVSR
jgi:elongation factor P hydroxylase